MICATDDPAHIACDRSARCTVNVLWVRVRDAITGTLDAMTLADLVPQRHIDSTRNPRSQEPLRDRRRRPRARHPRPPGRPRGQPRPRDPPGDQPHDPQGRDPRDHGPQRLGQDDARLRADGPPGVRRQVGRGPLEGLRPAQAVARQAVAAGAVPRLPVPDRRSPACRSRRSSAARSTRSSRASTRTPTSTRRTRPAAASRCSTSGARCARRWRSSRWRTASPPGT